MSDINHNRETINVVIRQIADLIDVQRAISAAARLSAEKLQDMEGALVNLLAEGPK